MICGFARAVRSEDLYKFANLDLDAEQQLDDWSSVQAILKVFRSVMGAASVENAEMEFQERKGEFWTPRIVLDETTNDYVHKKMFPPAVEETKFGSGTRALKMAIEKPGVFDSLYFVPDEQKDQELGDGEIEIRVKAVKLNTRDVQIALGHDESSQLGQECSGIVTRVGKDVKKLAVGDRVAAIAQGSFATFARTSADFAFKVGSTCFEDAAGLSLAHTSAHYGLVELARLEDAERVLVLNGAGAVGQAAIGLAQNVGASVFASVETAEDKRMLMQAFELPEDHIFYTKSDSLPASVLRATGGGVDVLFSAQAATEYLQSTLNCVAEFGRIVRSEVADSATAKLDLSALNSNTSFFSFDLFSLAARKPRVVRRLINDLSRSFKYGKLRPIQARTVSSIAEVSQAFKAVRSTSSSRIIVVPHADDIVKTTPSKEIVRRFKEDATYILIGGTGGLGRGMVRWMAVRGARHLVLLSRSGSVTGPVKTLVDDMAAIGVNVVVHSCDVAQRAQVDALLAKLTDLPPIRGVIHGAMVLRVSPLIHPLSHILTRHRTKCSTKWSQSTGPRSRNQRYTGHGTSTTPS